MSTDAEFKFRKTVKEHLKKLNNDLELVLKELINHKYPTEVTHLNFEIFLDGFTSGFPIQTFFLDNDNCEFFLFKDGKAEYPSPVDPELLNIDQVYPSELEDEYDDYELELWNISGEELVFWFSDIWKKITEKEFNLKATIGYHDGKTFDLIKQKWIE